MALVDRISRLVSETKRSNHLMAAAAWMWLRGEINRSQFKTALELDTTDDAQLDEMVTHYNALSDENKNLFFNDFSAYTIALEGGKITAAFFKTRFDLT